MRIEDLDTPALLLDVDRLEHNLKTMCDFAAASGKNLRPHFKVHKCIPITWRQLELGAIGVTCAKLSEAEVLADHGIDNILIANEIVGQTKIRRLLDLRKRADIMAAVDNADVAECLARDARAVGAVLPVLVDVNIGMNRCGIEPEQAAALVEKVSCLRGIEFRGIMGYEGHLVGLPPGDEKTKAVNGALNLLGDVRETLTCKGIEVPIVSAAGTGDYTIACQHPAVTELQVGTYAVMDTLYGGFVGEFQLAITVLCTVVSRPTRNRIILDAGRKAINCQLNLSGLKGRPTIFLTATHAEHGLMQCDEDAPDLKPGVKVELEMPYACGSIHLHEKIHVVREGEVVDIWPVAGRGKIQ